MKAEDKKKYGKELSVIGCKLNDLGARCALRYENDEQTLEDICKVGEDVFEISFKAGRKESVEFMMPFINTRELLVHQKDKINDQLREWGL